MKPLTIKVTREVTEEAILNSLINWHDSGVANFYVKHTDHRPYRDSANPKLWLPMEVTLDEGCDHEGKFIFTLDWAAVQVGLTIMAEKFPSLFNDEFPTHRDDYNGDANSADLFVQCCLFGGEAFA